MKKNKLIKNLCTISILAIISMVLTYGYQCLYFYLDVSGIPPMIWIPMIILSGLPLLICQGVFLRINRIYKRYHATSITMIITLEMVLYIILMLGVFGHIPIPYALIPRREMAAGAAQMATQIFAIATALLCVIISGIVHLLNKIRTKM